MKENVLQENAKFVWRVTLIHLFTYVLCGIVFSQLFNYTEMYKELYLRHYMREIDGVTAFGPFVQLIRGPLFGLILLLFHDSFMGKKYRAAETLGNCSRSRHYQYSWSRNIFD